MARQVEVTKTEKDERAVSLNIADRGVRLENMSASTGRDWSGAESLECGDSSPLFSAFFPTCFNGAAVFQPRKVREANAEWSELRRASMGPRSFNRGKQARDRDRLRGLPASMGPRSFNRGKG